MSSVLLADLLGRRVEVYDGVSGTHLMGAGEVIGICMEPMLLLRHDDGTSSHHSSALPRVEHEVIHVRHKVNYRPGMGEPSSIDGQENPT
jgi:hypothetical protein